MLFNEPKLLKSVATRSAHIRPRCFSALQRAEIAEIYDWFVGDLRIHDSFSALQRAEIAEMLRDGRKGARTGAVSVLFNEPKLLKSPSSRGRLADESRFSALQRAEIAEIIAVALQYRAYIVVSVLFNEPKLLKFLRKHFIHIITGGFSALQRAEIAEILFRDSAIERAESFQCSSTSRNC